MERLIKLKLFSSCPVRKSIINRLTNKGYDFCVQFITENQGLDKNQFARKVNMLFIDDPNKPKDHTHIWAILTEVNS